MNFSLKDIENCQIEGQNSKSWDLVYTVYSFNNLCLSYDCANKLKKNILKELMNKMNTPWNRISVSVAFYKNTHPLIKDESKELQ